MPRRPRQELAGGLFHVYARGVDKRTIFMDALDREIYLGLLGGVSRRQGWACLAYCLMGNHVHLLVETPKPNLGEGMRRLHGTYAQAFNERHVRWGHLFQTRFGDRRMLDDAELLEVVAYLATNPVAAGMCMTAEAYPWSSHAAVAAGRAPRWLALDRLNAHLAAHGADPVARASGAITRRLDHEAPVA